MYILRTPFDNSILYYLLLFINSKMCVLRTSLIILLYIIYSCLFIFKNVHFKDFFCYYMLLIFNSFIQ